MSASVAVEDALETAVKAEIALATARRECLAVGIDETVAPDLYSEDGDGGATSRLARAVNQVKSYATELATADVLVEAFSVALRDLCGDVDA
jgi:ferredoxin